VNILRGPGGTPSRFDSGVGYWLNKEFDLYKYIGTHTDDLLMARLSGTPTRHPLCWRTPIICISEVEYSRW
jgi:hypothetical protein